MLAIQSEGKTKMAFAKMQVPNELRGQYLLDDKDFEVNNDKPSTAPKVGTDDLLEGSQSATVYSDDFNDTAVVKSKSPDIMSGRKSPVAASRPGSRKGDELGPSPKSREKVSSTQSPRDRGKEKTSKHGSSNSSTPLPSLNRKSMVRQKETDANAPLGLYS